MKYFALILPLLLLLSAPSFSAPKAPSDDASAVVVQISINEADALGLTRLKGVGPKTAEAIIEYREKHGPFKNIAELKKVKGIGSKILEKNQNRITL